jgi:hypothetical protein
MGSAMDKVDIQRELRRYHDAGLGGVHIIPIYGAKGFENKFIDYLSPKWMDMLHFTVAEAHRLGMGVDMTTGTGWCFGGPYVTDEEANAAVICKTFELATGAKLDQKFGSNTVQALIAWSPNGKPFDITSKLSPDGTLNWNDQAGPWRIYAISQRPSGQKVKRAAPGGEGHMLNLFYPEAMTHYLKWFEKAFTDNPGAEPRAMYHDSYEYRSDWAPDLFQSFEKRRGYRLQNELPALFNAQTLKLIGSTDADSLAPFTDPDHIARVKSDYRETLSDVMAEDTLPQWVQWSHDHGFLVRNEAHGSPGNWLDLYAVADIPETEMFYRDRNKLVSKFASSAAHVAGKPLASSETGTWLKEHFTETLADVKYLFDDMFLSGINHMFYHGTCYSPDEAGWPGWHFYASLEMNPRNSIWRDASAVNAYAARCQSVLQSGKPDNDILIYWPIHDFWHSPTGMVQQFTVHAREWFEGQPIGHTATQLWNRGFSFDYISDRQLAAAKAAGNSIEVPGGNYRVIVVPPTHYMPVESFRQLLSLAKSGATVIFETRLPLDVPGWGALEQRRLEFKSLLSGITLAPVKASRYQTEVSDLQESFVGSGRILVGDLEPALARAGVSRETLFDHPDLMCVRRAFPGGHYYFIANRSETNSVNDWLSLATPAQSVVIMDPLDGRTGLAAVRSTPDEVTQIFVSLAPGQSLILRSFADARVPGRAFDYWQPASQPVKLTGTWYVQFIQGGPELPSYFQTDYLASWTHRPDTNAQRFAGTALYSLRFDAPDPLQRYWRIDLGKVAQSARVRLNGIDCGTLITPPFGVTVGPLKAKDNLLEVEVTNVSANRIRDLDRRGVQWKNYYDINFVNLNYRPFDASDWDLTDSGLLGPVTLSPVQRLALGQN